MSELQRNVQWILRWTPRKRRARRAQEIGEAIRSPSIPFWGRQHSQEVSVATGADTDNFQTIVKHSGFSCLAGLSAWR